MRDINIVRVEGISWSETSATHYYAQLGLPDKGRAIKVLPNLIPRVFGQKWRDLAPLNYPLLWELIVMDSLA